MTSARRSSELFLSKNVGSDAEQFSVRSAASAFDVDQGAYRHNLGVWWLPKKGHTMQATPLPLAPEALF